MSAVRRTTLYFLAGLVAGATATVFGFVFWASNRDWTEVRGAATGYTSLAVVMIPLIYRDLQKYWFRSRREPEELRRHTKRVAGVPVMDDE